MRDNETDSPVEVQEADAALYQQHVEEHARPQRCLHCDPTFKPTGPDDWCNCVCHDTGEF